VLAQALCASPSNRFAASGQAVNSGNAEWRTRSNIAPFGIHVTLIEPGGFRDRLGRLLGQARRDSTAAATRCGAASATVRRRGVIAPRVVGASTATAQCSGGGPMSLITGLLSACGGFLLAVLWMDLIFDAQVLGHRNAGDELPEPVLASIAGYYHRATTTSRPMSYLIALVMVIMLGGLGLRAVRVQDPGWLLAISAAFAGVPILLALIRTVPNAVRLGNRLGSPVEQSRLARSICRDHLLCVGCMLAFLVLWLTRTDAA
jgi:hypothetical protein